MTFASVDYPLLNVFLTMLWFFVFVLWLMLLFRVFADVFASDMRGISKAAWVVFVVVLPLVGVLIYLIARGDKMARREVATAQADEAAFRDYIRSAAATTSTPADQLARLADLKERGHLDEAEYVAMKSRIVE